MPAASSPAPSQSQIIERLLPRPAEQIAKSQYFRGGWYGLNGVGKTTLLSTVDKQWWVVSADRENVKPYLGLPNVRIIVMHEWNDLDDILHMAKIASKQGKLAGIGFDTWSRIQAHAFNHIARAKIIDPEDEAAIALYMEEGPRLPKGWEAWQQVGSLMAAWMDFFTGLPLHTVFLMQELTDRPKFENDILRTGPMLRPEAFNRAFESLELLGRLYVAIDEGGIPDPNDPNRREINPTAQEKRMLLIGAHPRFRAKGPSRELGYCIENPDWAKVTAHLNTKKEN
jgi:AAA domain-containing protein